MLGGVHNNQSRSVGGSLTDFDGPNTAGNLITGGKSNTAGGSLADAILNRVNAPGEENIPKIDIPDTSIKEVINPEELTSTITEQVRTMEDTSFSITGFLNTAIIYLAKIIFVGFDIENKIVHNGVLFLCGS